MNPLQNSAFRLMQKTAREAQTAAALLSMAADAEQSAAERYLALAERMASLGDGDLLALMDEAQSIASERTASLEHFANLSRLTRESPAPAGPL